MRTGTTTPGCAACTRLSTVATACVSCWCAADFRVSRRLIVSVWCCTPTCRSGWGGPRLSSATSGPWPRARALAARASSRPRRRRRCSTGSGRRCARVRAPPSRVCAPWTRFSLTAPGFASRRALRCSPRCGITVCGSKGRARRTSPSVRHSLTPSCRSGPSCGAPMAASGISARSSLSLSSASPSAGWLTRPAARTGCSSASSACCPPRCFISSGRSSSSAPSWAPSRRPGRRSRRCSSRRSRGLPCASRTSATSGSSASAPRRS